MDNFEHISPAVGFVRRRRRVQINHLCGRAFHPVNLEGHSMQQQHIGADGRSSGHLTFPMCRLRTSPARKEEVAPRRHHLSSPLLIRSPSMQRRMQQSFPLFCVALPTYGSPCHPEVAEGFTADRLHRHHSHASHENRYNVCRAKRKQRLANA